MPFNLYSEAELPSRFRYPPRLVELAASIAFDLLYPWWFVDAKTSTGQHFIRHIQENDLVPFAKTDETDDLACLDAKNETSNPRVIIRCSTSDRSYQFTDFDDWLTFVKRGVAGLERSDA